MKAILLKYALTSGPTVIEVERVYNNGAMVFYRSPVTGFHSARRSEYATSVAEAEMKVLEMIEERKALLAGQIKRLEDDKPEILRCVRRLKL